MKKWLWSLIAIILITATSYWAQSDITEKPASVGQKDAITLVFPKDRYPETGAHIQSAIEHGQSAVCTIDRAAAEHHRDLSLKGVPTKKGYDRDEWPMAMCAEGGSGADIRYVTPTDNRGAGSWISNQLDKYPDGTKVQFIVK
ncbi:NucA/NucB deoxyribonuclease domain-containing protein [Paenibacillus aestuarii]|uniref:NucA/NucB deoxyribonuclease domain-containing protein n=1 Tax=Paenibacillus aestuarii TaxID=516965 RepID=A0ABW0K5C0_9BACL|nr:NucA/NucB deoxyribonuclease domain-containing protein [Paenibacillus aestuarii]